MATDGLPLATTAAPIYSGLPQQERSDLESRREKTGVLSLAELLSGIGEETIAAIAITIVATLLQKVRGPSALCDGAEPTMPQLARDADPESR